MTDLALASKTIRLDARSRYLRELIIDALAGGGRGHVGSTLSLVEILRALYDEVMHYRADEPSWEGRDRCILSKGHGCLALYALLADKGFFGKEELLRQCWPGATLGGHPERGRVPGVEASTGALGHGLSIGVGLALGLRLKGNAARVYVVMGDGELNEGAVWEAAMSAAKHHLGNLTALVDYNKLQSYGPIDDVVPLEPLAEKWRSFGFAVQEANGHNVGALVQALRQAATQGAQPSIVICHTVKGKGLDFAEGNPNWHHKAKIKDNDLTQMREALVRY